MTTTKVETTVYRQEWLTIESCLVCQGTGVQTIEEMTDYHKREYSDFHYECKVCEGEGRRLKKTLSIYGDVCLPENYSRIPYKKNIDIYESMKNRTIHDVYKINKR